MHIETKTAYICQHCGAAYFDENQCSMHENTCEQRPLVCPKVTYLKHAMNPDDSFDSLFSIDKKAKHDADKYKCAIKFELCRAGKVMDHAISMTVRLNPKDRSILSIGRAKLGFDDYFAYWPNRDLDNECYNSDRATLKRLFSHQSKWIDLCGKAVPNCLELTEFDFGRYTIDFLYSNGDKLAFDDFTEKNNYGRWCNIPLHADNDLHEIIIIEKHIHPEVLKYESVHNRCITKCPYRPDIVIGSQVCQKCRHSIGQSWVHVRCNYKQDNNIL